MGLEHLHLLMVPINDDFDDAIDLGGRDLGYIGASSVGATKQPGEPDHAGNPGGASIWFTWTAPITGSLSVDACDTTFPRLLAVYTGSSVTDLTPVRSIEVGQAQLCRESPEKALDFNVDVGTTYRIAIDGYGGAEGFSDLFLSSSPLRIKFPEPPVLPRDLTPPDTRLSRRLFGRGGYAVFGLASTEVGSSFLCRLDAHRLKPCRSVVTYRGLKAGRHVFVARAEDAAGNIDATPLTVRFRVPERRARHRIAARRT